MKLIIFVEPLFSFEVHLFHRSRKLIKNVNTAVIEYFSTCLQYKKRAQSELAVTVHVSIGFSKWF